MAMREVAAALLHGRLPYFLAWCGVKRSGMGTVSRKTTMLHLRRYRRVRSLRVREGSVILPDRRLPSPRLQENSPHLLSRQDQSDRYPNRHLRYRAHLDQPPQQFNQHSQHTSPQPPKQTPSTASTAATSPPRTHTQLSTLARPFRTPTCAGSRTS